MTFARLAGLCCALLVASTASAQHNASRAGASASAVQAVRAVRLLPGLQLGGVLPTGELADFHNTGLRAGATLAAVVPTRPFGVRLALTYDRLSGGTVSAPGGALVQVGAGSMLSLSLAGLVSEQAERNALLYFTGGVGVHRLEASGTVTPSGGDDEPTEEPIDEVVEQQQTKAGASVGGGITFRVGGLPAYLEVQIVKLFGADALLVPLVFGVQFDR